MFLYNMFFSNITLFKRSSNKCYKAYTRSQIVNTLHLARVNGWKNQRLSIIDKGNPSRVNVSENSRSQIVNFAGHTSQIVNTTDWCACYTPLLFIRARQHLPAGLLVCVGTKQKGPFVSGYKRAPCVFVSAYKKRTNL
jgi:hypothetical protein